MSKIKKIIIVAMLLALLIVLSRFISIKTPVTKLSFAFIPTMLCAAWFGPCWTILLNFLGDIVGATFFPTGPFFIGYTISTVIAATIYGFLLYRKPDKKISEGKYIILTIVAVLLVTVIVNMGLNTFWSHLTTGKAFWGLLGVRIVGQLVAVPVHIIVFLILEKVLRRPFQRFSEDKASAEIDMDEEQND